MSVLPLKEDPATKALRGLCVAPFFDKTKFSIDEGFLDGRFCQQVLPGLDCCLPCPMADFVYPDFFRTLTAVANWVAVVGATCCVFLLLSYGFLKVEQTHRHHQSVALTFAVLLMTFGFIIPLIDKPTECANEITPFGMASSTSCATSGSFLLFGGFAGVMWVLMRAVSLHLQICWGVVVGRGYMWFSQATAWLIPVIIVTLSLIFSGVSFRFGQSCHINHKNSLSDFWIPLLIMSSSTLIIQLGTFVYCLKVYLASLSDNGASSAGSSLPTYTNSIRTLSPRQAYRRIRRVIQLQWRGIVIVLIIIADVIFFTVVFVWQDRASEDVKHNPELSKDWIQCLAKAYAAGGDKNDCLKEASELVMSEAIVTAVLLLMALNGVWLMLLLGRWSMFTGWAELIRRLVKGKKKEFVSVDARYDMKKDQRSYEMLSTDSSTMVTPLSPVKSPASPSSGMRTPDYFGRTARYQPPARSFSSPRPPQSPPPGSTPVNGWDATTTYARPQPNGDLNPLGMNRI